MSDWTDGYIAEVDYTHGYYAELNPLRLAPAFLNVGLMPPSIATACELGFGNGVSVNIHAAASTVRWYGTDLLPGHVGFARSLADAAGSGAQLFNDSFAEFNARDDLPDFDFIGLHGVYSWISAENRQILVDFVGRKLKVGGVLYISYNSHPGSAAAVPLRHLLARHAAVMGTPGEGILSRLDGAIAFVDRLVAVNPVFFAANPLLGERLRFIKSQSRNYVAHEYLHRDWHVAHFADMAEQLARAKLTYACSAHPLDHVDALNMTPERQRFLAEIPDPIFRQTVRDFVVNQQFRRDYWVKGVRRLSPLEQGEMVRQLKVMLTMPSAEVALTVNGAIGQREMSAAVYEPILAALADHDARTLGEIEQALGGAGIRLSTIYEAILVLLGKGDLALVQDDAAQAEARPGTDRLNRHLCERACASNDLLTLASPVTGGGIAAGRFQQLFLLALQGGHQSADELARYAWDIIGPQGHLVVKDGKGLATPEENRAELAAQASEFLDKRLGLLRKLQVA